MVDKAWLFCYNPCHELQFVSEIVGHSNVDIISGLTYEYVYIKHNDKLNRR